MVFKTCHKELENTVPFLSKQSLDVIYCIREYSLNLSQGIKIVCYVAMNKKTINRLVVFAFILLFCGVSLQSLHKTNVLGSHDSMSLVIDIFTQKEPYNGKGLNKSSDAFSPQEEVILYAYVEYNGSYLPHVLVTFSVHGPPNPLSNITLSRTAETNLTGMASISFIIPWPCENPETKVFGIWNASAYVEVKSETFQDTLTFKVGWIVDIVSIRTVDNTTQTRTRFGIEGYVGVELTIRNIAMIAKKATICLTLCDELNVPIDYVEINDFEVQPNETLVRLYCRLFIPKWTAVGNATLYGNVLNAPSFLGGVPYCPEKSVDLLIFINEDPLMISLPDVSVVSVTPSLRMVYIGEEVNVSVVVRNEGTETGTFNVSTYFGSKLIDVAPVELLVPYSQVTLSFTWNTSNVLEGNYTISATASLLPAEVEVADNLYVDGVVTVKSPALIEHDIAIINVVPSALKVNVGETVNVSVNVKNEGETAETFDVNLYYNACHLDTQQVVSLPSGASKILIFTWNTSNVSPSNYTISAYVPPVPGEVEVEDNKFVDGVIEIKLPPVAIVHDVAVVSVVPSANEVFRGQIVNITVIVRNEGNETESFDVSARYNAKVIDTIFVHSLSPKSERTLTFVWNTSDVSEGNYTISGYAAPVIEEIDVSDNEFIDGFVIVKVPTPAPVWYMFDITLLLLLLILIPLLLLLLLLIALLLRRKKKKRQGTVFAVVFLHI